MTPGEFAVLGDNNASSFQPTLWEDEKKRVERFHRRGASVRSNDSRAWKALPQHNAPPHGADSCSVIHS